MKLYHNVYGYKISDEFDYGHYPTSMSWVICPWISKNAINHFVYTLGPSFLHQSWLFLYSMFITIRSWMSSILKEFWMIEPELRSLGFMKIELIQLLIVINILYKYKRPKRACIRSTGLIGKEMKVLECKQSDL